MCAWYRSRAGSVILDYIVVVVVVVVVVVAAIVVLLVVVPSQDPFVASKPTYAPATYSDFIFGVYAGIIIIIISPTNAAIVYSQTELVSMGVSLGHM